MVFGKKRIDKIIMQNLSADNASTESIGTLLHFYFENCLYVIFYHNKERYIALCN